MSVAPCRKHLIFSFGSSFGYGNLQDIRDAKRPQLADLPCGPILIRKPPTNKLAIISSRRGRKNGYSRRDAALNEVCRFYLMSLNPSAPAP
jgi:hypothetical protein